MALDALTASLGFTLNIQAEKIQAGFSSRKVDDSKNKKISFTVGVGANQVNEAYGAVRELAAAANETLDLTAALTNILGDASVTVARVKGLVVWLLGASDTVGEGDGAVTGTACSSITLGAAAATPFLGPLGGTAPTYTVTNSGFWIAGRGDATGWPVAGADQLKVVNNDGAVVAKYFLGLLMGAT